MPAAVFPEGPSRVLPNGLPVTCVSTLDLDFLYNEIFISQIYLQHGVVLKAGEVVLDVGANIGLFSAFAAQRVGSKGRVIALEPVAAVYDALQHNIRMHATWAATQNTPAAEIVALNMGAGDGSKSSVAFTTYSNFSCWNTMYKQDEAFHQRHIAEYVKRNITQLAGMPPSLYNHAARFFWHWVPHTVFTWCMRRYVRNTLLASAEETCALTTVSEVIRRQQLHRIHLLKIDVEGAELDVLRGVEPEHWPRIQQVVVEVESYALDGTSELSSVERLLGKAGFDCIVVDEPLKSSRVFQVYAWRSTNVPADAQKGRQP